MPLKIVRNDITRMQTEAIVNTANDNPTVGTGCDYAIYKAAGYEQLLAYREAHIGFVPEGDAFITPGFDLPCKYIIHAVSPFYQDGCSGEEELLRSCYRKSLKLALEHGVSSVAFPLISTGGFGYPKEEGFRIAVDEIHAFLMAHEMTVYIVVFDEKATELGSRLSANLDSYIDQNYVQARRAEEYFGSWEASEYSVLARPSMNVARFEKEAAPKCEAFSEADYGYESELDEADYGYESELDEADYGYESALDERISHVSDTFSEYLIYLIDSKGMSYPEVYKRALIDKKVFSKLKNNPDAHPKKMTAMCLCIGAKLNIDQTRDLLARAGYALSPCDKTDIIFSFFIENGIYDMIELDIQLEEHGLACLI